MILGMSVPTFTLLHVIISLIGIATGIVVALALMAGRRLAGWTGLFLITTVLTSVTGFFFHSTSFGPPHVVGVLSLVILALAIPALYSKRLAGGWRAVYVIGAIAALWFNCFVGVVQAFQKLPFFHALAPTQKEPPFLIAQGLVLAIFVVVTVVSLRKFRPATY
jgi:hypothetical protein